jgi:hypothetical protein
MTSKEIVEQGFASYKELKDVGIKNTIDLGTNEFGFKERIIILNNNSQWDYIPEDELYELRVNH